ncbi:hypothetical protein H6P81_009640 [Aristolochia fimbriata]|uniref:DYW domain-containing protein n=1 Tax=Aristolochia fimbriata TaxID=158543 RepID=A0AAV7ELI3_ARIFI|nr:hypothetical protein H6P81_009640 [Aristolochia fimbriata]
MAAPLLLSANPNPVQLLPHIFSFLERCSDMKETKQIHARLIKTRLLQDNVAARRLIASYVKLESQSLSYAKSIFDRIHRPNILIWNIMIRAYSYSKQPYLALLLYVQMLARSPLCIDAFFFPFLLKACADLSALQQIQQIHSQIVKTGFCLQLYAVNSLLHAYAKCGCVSSARLLFDRIPMRDGVSWNSMIDGYAKAGQIEKASEIFRQMPARNVISWTSMIKSHVECGLYKEALSLFHDMLIERLEPDAVTLAIVLSACAQLGALDQGIWVRSYIDRNEIKMDSFLSCALVDMYAKCGEVEEALSIFKKTKKKTVQTWTAMITGLAAGYTPATKSLLLNLEEEEKATAVQQHSEKLAIAFGLISTREGTVIRIVKNLRVCEDCHSVTKLISKLYDRQIVVRDRTRFHLFKEGCCSCEDCW